MTYPAGVQLSTLTFNSPTTYLGNPVTRTEITVQLSAGVVWAATGETIADVTASVALGPGMPGAVTFPTVDQSGFTNQSGTTITMWSYAVTRKMFFGSSSVVVQKNWQPLTGQVTTDFDTLPAGAAVTPPPVFPVTSVAGKTGTVGAADLAGVLAPFLPTPDMPGKLDASKVGAPSGVAPLDPFSKVPDANLPATSNASALAGKTDKTTTAAASDPLAYLNNVAILCQFPVRENGETFWPQGISINKADNEIYVSNASSDAASLRIDVRDLTTGVRKSFSPAITVTASTWSEGLPWFKNGSGQLCFIVRTTPETGAASTYSIYNYTTSTLGSPIAINGPFKSDVNGDTFVTSDAYNHAATTFYIYSWASIQAGTPTLLATAPLENPGQDIGKTQGVAVVGSNLYILTGDQASNPGIMVYDFTGKLLAVRDYAKADFQAAVNVLKPGYLTNNSFVYECEGATNLDGKLVTGQIVNNNPPVTADGIMLVLQHNRIDGAHIKSRPLANYVRDTGWVTLTPASGWTIGGGINIQARRIGNEVRLRGHPLNASTTAATWTTLATLPAGMIPSASVQFAQSSNTTATMAARVNSNGTIDSWTSVATGAWRPLNGITFLLD